MAVVANVFQSIESGKFSNFNAHASANQDAVANMALLPKVDAQYSQDIIEVVTNYFSTELFYGPETSLNIHDVKTLTDPTRKKEYTAKINRSYDAAITKILGDLASRYAYFDGNENVQLQILNTVEYIEENLEAIKDVHRLYLHSIGINFNFEYDLLKKSM